MKQQFLRLARLALVVAMALRCDTGSPVDPDSAGNGSQLGRVRGTVMANGSPLPGIYVSITGTGVARTVWSEDGTFSFIDLPPGTYSLTAATGPGFACDATAEVAEGQTVTADIDCIDLHGAIAGTLMVGGAPLGGVEIWLTGGTEQRRRISASDGTFTFPGLVPGTYSLITAGGPALACGATVQLGASRTVFVDMVCSDFQGDWFRGWRASRSSWELPCVATPARPVGPAAGARLEDAA